MTDLAAAPEWVFYLTRPSGPNVGSLGAARTRRLSFVLDGPASVSFTMPADHPETALIEELATDVICGRNGVALFRGRVGASSDTLSANAATSTFAAVDYRGLLGRRILWSGQRRSFRGRDQADIAWDLITDTQALPGGNLGIIRGYAAATGRLRDRDYDAGKNLGETIDQLGQVIDGFDWDVDALRRFNLYYPRRGRLTGLVLSYGRDITDLRRSLNPGEYANAVRFNGAEGTQAVELAVTAFHPEIGRWDAQRSDVNLLLQSTIDQRAAFELEAASDFVPAFSVAMPAGRWDPGELWVGDTARLVVKQPRLDVDVTRRIVGVDIDIDDDGGETVRLSVGAAEATLTGRIGSYDSRLKDLERAGDYIPEMPVGGMYDFAGRTPPRLTMWADGSWLAIAEYPELYAVIGRDYTGPTVPDIYFALPDCRGRMTVAAGVGVGLTGRQAGQTGGAETVVLTVAEQGPPHFHPVALGTGVETATHSHSLSISSGPQTVSHTHDLSIASGADSPAHVHNLGWNAPASQLSGGSYAAVVPGGATATSTPTATHSHVTSGSTVGPNADHGHIVNGSTVGANQGHLHPITGNTNTSFGGAAHENMPPWIAIGRVIKVRSAHNQ
ncbi:MAG TPA: tail fiber protein [Acidimicrobiales bacterium]|nr:tail fiber protein [Acidimicrobiales bacterium]